MTEYLPGYGPPPALAIWLRAMAAVLERAAHRLDRRPVDAAAVAARSPPRVATAADVAARPSRWERPSGASRVESIVLLATLAFFAGGLMALLTLP